MSEVKEKKKRKGLWWKIPLGVFALLIVVSVISGNNDKKDTPASNSPATTEVSQSNKNDTLDTTQAKKKIGVGEAITVGEVKWIVGVPEKKEIIKGANSYQTPAKPNGVFIVVPLTAELVGKESGTIDSSQLKIIDSAGRSFEPTDDFNVAIIYTDASIFLKKVNPNVPIKGVAVFDIAKDAKGLKLKIDDLRSFGASDPQNVELGL